MLMMCLLYSNTNRLSFIITGNCSSTKESVVESRYQQQTSTKRGRRRQGSDKSRYDMPERSHSQVSLVGPLEPNSSLLNEQSSFMFR